MRLLNQENRTAISHPRASTTMIRSGSKLLKKGGSVRNINKVGFKFRFVIEFETADKLLTNADVVATWERKGTVLSTVPVPVDTKARTADFAKAKLEQLVTLFKPKKSGAGIDFHEKPYTFSIRTHNDKGKTIGKAALNLAEYVGVPDCSKRISVPLSHDGNLIMRVTSTYVGEARRKNKTGKSSAGASSVFSSSTIGAASSKSNTHTPGNRSNYEHADQSDLSDLFIDGDFEGIKSSSSSTQVRIAPSQSRKENIDSASEKDLAPSQSRKKLPRVETSAILGPSQSQSRTKLPRVEKSAILARSQPQSRTKQAANVVPSRSRRRERAEENKSKQHSVDKPEEPGVPVVPVARPKSSVETVSQADYDKLKRDNRALVRRNNDIYMRNEQLEDKLSDMDVDKILVLEDQVEALKEELRDLKERLAREPVYLDVVKELKDAKMGLAILSTENAELKLRCLQLKSQ